MRGDSKSQIDFLLTSRSGIDLISKFELISHNWHLSDHRPISAELKSVKSVNLSNLLLRSNELIYEYEPNPVSLHNCCKKVDHNRVRDYFSQNHIIIQRKLEDALISNTPLNAVDIIDTEIRHAHKLSKISRSNFHNTNPSSNLMQKANDAFLDYRNALNQQDQSTNSVQFYLDRFLCLW